MTEHRSHMASGARVQVFIPTYNRADRLEQAISSVLDQSWPHVEVVVLDNQSTDHTIEVMKRLVDREPRITYVRHPCNIGMIANFNAIPGLVDGDFFAMLTDDDTYEPGFIATALSLFDEHPEASLVACDAPTRHHGVVKGSQLDYWREGYHPPGTGVIRCLLGHYPIITNCLFRTALREQFCFDPGLGNTGDGFILTSICANHAIGVSRYVSGYWNNDGDNASSLQGFDAGLIARIAIAEYALYRELLRRGRFARRWLIVVWVKRALSVLIAADRTSFASLRANAPIDRAFGPLSRMCLSVLTGTRTIRLFPWILSNWRRYARSQGATLR